MPKRAVTSASFGNKDGTITVIPENAVFDDDHEMFDYPMVKANPQWFVDVLDDPLIEKRSRRVEQATAGPGEKRGASTR